ncbi:MAG: tail fiber domain-containing protein [Candidatus Omnitrophica bacterium]|nr:tail fiber domain-containing protein [Candidatus Omnitrophota bacterium]MDD5660402.1 tail fiber domain-containing protein [Candidatus Omnitrophota bacterium]
MNKLLRSLGLISFFLFFSLVLAFAEEITITTYYPSPYGSYRELRSTRVAIGDNYIDGAAYTWEATNGDGGEVDYLADLVVEGNVGIGTANPVAKLDIFDNSATGFGEKLALRRSGAGQVGLSFQQNGVTAFGIVARSGAGSGLAFVDNFYEASAGNERMRILSNGNVGIGTSAPAQRLEVTGDGIISNRLRIGVLPFNDDAVFSGSSSTGLRVVDRLLYVGPQTANLPQGNGNPNYAWIAAGNAAGCNWGNRRYGVFGVGTTAGVYGQGFGDMVAGWHAGGLGYADPGGAFYSGVYGNMGIGGYGGYFVGPVYISGNTGIGIANPRSKLDVVGGVRTSKGDPTPASNGANVGFSFEQDGDTGMFAIGGSSHTGSDLVFKLDASEAMRIKTSTGRVGIGVTDPGSYQLYVNGSAYATGGWHAPSDMRYKKNVGNINNPLEKLSKVRGVSFEWKTDEYKDKKFSSGRHYGVIAQEIEKVMPEVVKEGADGEKAVSYVEIVPVLIEAIKAQQQEIDALKQEMAKLKAK